MSELLDAVADVPIIAILRAADARAVTAVAETLFGVGIRAVEVTLTTAGALRAVEQLTSARHHPLVGAGTVRSVDDVARAVDAGARFVVSPDTNPEVVAAAIAAGLDAVPGAFTATEIGVAERAGATAVKLFPASLGGPDYLTAIRQPFPSARLVPTGGVTAGSAPAYLAAGALALGVGGPLIGDALAGGDLDELARRAASFVAASVRPPAQR